MSLNLASGDLRWLHFPEIGNTVLRKSLLVLLSLSLSHPPYFCRKSPFLGPFLGLVLDPPTYQGDPTLSCAEEDHSEKRKKLSAKPLLWPLHGSPGHLSLKLKKSCFQLKRVLKTLCSHLLLGRTPSCSPVPV